MCYDLPRSRCVEQLLLHHIIIASRYYFIIIAFLDHNVKYWFTSNLCNPVIKFIKFIKTLFIAKDRVCFLPIAILLSLVALYRIVWF